MTPSAAPRLPQPMPAPSQGTAPASGSGGRVYFPNLDGLRFWAFFGVMAYHCSWVVLGPLKDSAALAFYRRWSVIGTQGVSFFFVLSGFLITYLLLAERQRTGRIDILGFYARRALRIWPLYFLMAALNYALPVGKPPGDTTMVSPLYYLSFTLNFVMHLGGSGPTGRFDSWPGPSGVLWSVCVEEQFYLAWPLLMSAALGLLAKGRRSSASSHNAAPDAAPPLDPTWLFASVCLLSLASRWALREEPVRSYHFTLSVIGDMALGGWAAWKCFSDERWPRWSASLSRSAIFGGYALLIAALALHVLLMDKPRVLPFERCILQALFVFVILEQCYAERSLFKWGRQRILSRLGTYSYGLYCIHCFPMFFVGVQLNRLGLDRQMWQFFALQIPLTLALSVALAALSYHFYEKPFLRLKRRFAHVQTT